MSLPTSKIITISSENDLKQILAEEKKVVVINFWADWCQLSASMNDVFTQLCESWSDKVVFVQINAEEADFATDRFDISSVPTFVFVQEGQTVDSVVGAHAHLLASKVEKWVNKSTVIPSSHTDLADNELNQRIKRLLTCAPILALVKGGLPDCKGCENSRNLLQLLNNHKIPYSVFDVSKEPEVMEGLKVYSGWPTFPQLWAHNKLLGGFDFIANLESTGELLTVLGPAIEDTKVQRVKKEEDFQSRLKNLINQAPVMVFIKGTPDAPRCGFSNQIVNVLNQQGVKFSSFNILNDSEVREGLKKLSNWPTYPQLYIEGKLIGGLDIIKEMIEDGELRELVPPSCLEDQ